MNAAKMTLTATILAAALGLVLGLAPAPAEAHHCKGGHANDPLCPDGGGGGGGGGQDATIFDVTVDGLAGENGGTSTCMGRTNPPKLDVNFEPGCTVFLSGLNLNLFALAVRTRNNGMTDVLIFFTSGDPSFPVTDNDLVYKTERLGAKVVMNLDLDGSFSLVLEAEDDVLIKEHQPDKGDVVGTFSVVEFFYTPVE